MKYSGIVLDPNAFHYMDTNSSNVLQKKEKKKKVIQVELVLAPYHDIYLAFISINDSFSNHAFK